MYVSKRDELTLSLIQKIATIPIQLKAIKYKNKTLVLYSGNGNREK
jgi:hypothetical protein